MGAQVTVFTRTDEKKADAARLGVACVLEGDKDGMAALKNSFKFILKTRAVLDFCAEHGSGPDIQVIPIQEINDARRRVGHGDVRFRCAIDIASLRSEEAETRADA